MQANSSAAAKFSLDLTDETQCQSKEAWPADYVKSEFAHSERYLDGNQLKSILFISSAILLGGTSADGNSRKRKNNDWNQQQSNGDDDFASENLPEPQVKVANRERKSQGERI